MNADEANHACQPAEPPSKSSHANHAGSGVSQSVSAAAIERVISGVSKASTTPSSEPPSTAAAAWLDDGRIEARGPEHQNPSTIWQRLPPLGRPRLQVSAR